jgi:hypothetical protein
MPRRGRPGKTPSAPGQIEDLYLTERDTPEMKAMGRASGRVRPATGGRFLAWVLDGASPDERALSGA